MILSIYQMNMEENLILYGGKIEKNIIEEIVLKLLEYLQNLLNF